MKIKTHAFVVLSIFLSAVFLRIFFVFIIHPPEKYIYSDMNAYHGQAVKLAAGYREDIFDTFHPPGTHYLYSLFLRSPDAFLRIKIFNILAGVLTCLLIFENTRLLFNKKAALVAFIIASFNYLFIDFEGYFLSETPFILGLSALMYCLLKSIKSANIRQKYFYAFLTGFCVALSASFKASILLFVPLFGIWWLINFKKYKLTANIIFYSLGFLPLLILMMLRVFCLTGQWGGVATCAGEAFYENRVRAGEITFYDKERRYHFGFGSPVAFQKKYSFTKHFEVGPYESGYFFKEGIREAKKDIPKAILYSLENIWDLFYSTVIWPTAAIEGILPKIIKFFNIIFVYAIIFPVIILFFFKWRHMTRSLKILPYLVISVAFVQAFVFVGDPRHRVPYDIFFIMLAGYLYSTAWALWVRRAHKIR